MRIPFQGINMKLLGGIEVQFRFLMLISQGFVAPSVQHKLESLGLVFDAFKDINLTGMRGRILGADRLEGGLGPFGKFCPNFKITVKRRVIHLYRNLMVDGVRIFVQAGAITRLDAGHRHYIRSVLEIAFGIAVNI